MKVCFLFVLRLVLINAILPILATTVNCKEKSLFKDESSACNEVKHCLSTGQSFYVWAAKSKIRRPEHSKRIYVRFFDVVPGKGGMPMPESVRVTLPESYSNVEIVPVVYLTVSALKITNSETRSELARNMIQKLESQWQPIHEFQLDCDWTASTRDAYFELVNMIQDLRPRWTVGATIRLHQLKYREQTGIPPVDYGVLMLYNTGNVTDPKEHNSILSTEVVKKYLRPDYPLKLRIALPAFSWVVIFQNGSFHSIISGIQKSQIEKLIYQGSASILKQGSLIEGIAPAVKMNETVMMAGKEIVAGSILRYEFSSYCQIQKLSKAIAKNHRLQKDYTETIWFDLDSIQATDSELNRAILNRNFMIDQGREYSTCKLY